MVGMECGCVCDIEYDPPAFLCSREITARKGHRCCECGESILPGKKYEYVSGMWEKGKVYTFHTCLVCALIRSEYCCSYGGVREDLWEALGLDYISNEIID